jgi:CubicO group peptidase (beta-lactamase class C family)
MITKLKYLFLMVFTIFLVMNTNLSANSEITQSSILEKKILRIENSLSPTSDEDEALNSKFNIIERMEFYQTPGVSIAVINNGQIEWAKGYGVKKVGESDRVDSKTLFQAASISKPVTAVAVMKLVQEGKLNLERDVNQNLVSWKIPNSSFTEEKLVTLRNLLSHTAGLTVHGFEGYSFDASIPTLLQILNGEKPANSDEIEVSDELDREFKYSGGGYVVIQQLLEDITGKPFDTFMAETVLNELGMADSTYQQPLPKTKTTLAASGHNDKGKPLKDGWHIYPEMAAAGLWTTPTDLAKFAIAIQTSIKGVQNSFLDQQIVNEMLTPQVGGWGLGFELPERTTRFAHGGSNEGFQCLMMADKNTGQGAVVMTNSDQGLTLAIETMKSISEVYGWDD